MSETIKAVRQELRKNADEKNKESGKRFFKEAVKLYGVKTALVSKIGERYFQEIKNLSKTQVFSFCDELWQSGYLEETFIACKWSYRIRNQYKPEDFKVIKSWVESYVTNWASCDTLCNHTVGSFIEMYPEYLKELKQWAQSPNRWVRRASAVSLIIQARHGKFLKEIFELAENLLVDKDDMVQKGYGWLLKAASESHQQEVFDFVMKHKKEMPRTALRYAIEKMPEELKKHAMAKIREVTQIDSGNSSVPDDNNSRKRHSVP